MSEFKGTKGNWVMLFNHYKKEPKKICVGVGMVEKLNDSSEYTEFVCNSLLPATDEEYIKQRVQIEADMKLIASAPKMLAALIEISEWKGSNIAKLIQLAKEVINEAASLNGEKKDAKKVIRANNLTF